MRGRDRSDGFTLIEITVVMGLIALILAVTVASLDLGSGLALDNSGRVLAAELEYAGQRAVATGIPQRWVVDLDAQAFRLEELDVPPFEGPPELPENADALSLAPPLAIDSYRAIEGRPGEWRVLDDKEIGIDEVEVAGESKQDGVVAVGFQPDGGADAARIWLLDPSGYEVEVRIVGFTGEVRLGDDPRG